MATEISAEKYVSLGSFKKDGSAVATPVWIAPLSDGRVGFTTDAGSWKVKRINANASVTLQPCNMKGDVADGTEEVGGQAEVVHGAEVDDVKAAIKAKYGFQVTLIEGLSKLKSLVGKASSSPSAVIITLDE